MQKTNRILDVNHNNRADPVSELVSIHGGHSGEFCNHAQGSLEDIIKAYVKKGFSWVGITEHMPPVNDNFLYQDEKEAGLDAKKMYRLFARYFLTCRKLQKKYAPLIKIYAGFEAETYTGSEQFIQKLINTFRPDYIVGSIHHVNDIPIDYTIDLYEDAAYLMGSIDALYCEYFDRQYEMIKRLKPSVIGHFDLIRIFDQDYRLRLKKDVIQKRIRRNLECIKKFNLILDFNVRSFSKGGSEPYISESILLQALELKIAVVPGDDSHSVETVGLNIEKGIKILKETGFDIKWKNPAT